LSETGGAAFSRRNWLPRAVTRPGRDWRGREVEGEELLKSCRTPEVEKREFHRKVKNERRRREI
jgi:hypothetical protein